MFHVFPLYIGAWSCSLLSLLSVNSWRFSTGLSAGLITFTTGATAAISGTADERSIPDLGWTCLRVVVPVA